MRRLLYNKQGKVVCLVSGSTLDKRECPHSPRSWSPVAREAECIASAQGSTGVRGGTRGRGSPNHGQRARAHSPPIQQPSCRAVVLHEDTGDVRDGVDGHGWGRGSSETKQNRFGCKCNLAPQRCIGGPMVGTRLTTWSRPCMS